MIVNKCVDIERISIHAPREGCDRLPFVVGVVVAAFQSTHPGRGATCPLTVLP